MDGSPEDVRGQTERPGKGLDKEVPKPVPDTLGKWIKEDLMMVEVVPREVGEPKGEAERDVAGPGPGQVRSLLAILRLAF